MSTRFPYLDVLGPDSQALKVELTKERLTIGRFPDYNDLALQPDPQQLVTRKVHCAAERDAEGWWVVDNGSVNRTFDVGAAAKDRARSQRAALYRGRARAGLSPGGTAWAVVEAGR